jgi:hypothetical protein
MMIRMERVTATWALALPRRWPPGRDGRAASVALVLLVGAGAGSGLVGPGAQPGPGHQVGGGGEAGHVQAYFRDDRPGYVRADAGDPGKPGHGGQGGGVRAGPGVRAGGPVGVYAQAAGIAATSRTCALAPTEPRSRPSS